jgi:hypothetical protein
VSLERRLLGARRDGDVPGFEIPSRYFQFVRTGDARPLVPVLEHNRLDLLSLAALTARLLGLVRSGPSAAVDAQEALALGRIYEGAASGDRARESFERAICLGSPFDPSAAIEGLRALARLERRERRYGAAAGAWRRLLEIPGCPPHVRREASEALAIHHEHRVGDLGAARTFALRSLSFSAGDRRRTASGRHRLARLDRKMAAGGTGFVDRDGLQFKR